eukprot:8616095-Heterocapsa_arctica.AAC.1
MYSKLYDRYKYSHHGCRSLDSLSCHAAVQTLQPCRSHDVPDLQRYEVSRCHPSAPRAMIWPVAR